MAVTGIAKATSPGDQLVRRNAPMAAMESSCVAPAAANGGQQPPQPVKIAFVLYPGFTALDIIGPFEVLAFVPGHEAVFVAAEPGPVTDDTGRCQLVASTSLDQMTAPDVVVIGVTLSTEEPDQAVVQRSPGG